MNLLQYVNKSETINNKLNSLLNLINYDYQNGKIRTETEYYYRIKNMLDEFYQSLNTPMFKYRPAISTPMSDEYNSMITETYKDLEYIINDCKILNELILQSFTDAELSRTMMTNSLNYLSKKIEGLGQSIFSEESISTVVFTELFNNTDTMGNLEDNDSCSINTKDGILTLRNNMSNGVAIKKIEIDNDVSNGFPGNTHCVDTLNSELHFLGQEGLHLNPYDMIDMNSDTWYEFELFSITDEVRKQCNSFGFEYDEGVSWINNKDSLRLKITLTLNSSEVCSWLSITPYLSNIKGTKNCILEYCDIVTASNNIYRVCDNQGFDDVLVFPFPPQEVKQIILSFIQPYKYQTKVGHYYYTAADTSNMSIFQEYDYSDMFSRVDGEKSQVSLLGVRYNPQTQWLDYSLGEQELPSEVYIKSKLFTLPNTTIDKKANQEIIDAYRYVIGIRNIKMTSSYFVPKGQYVSIPFNTEEVITSISLESNEYIPGDDIEILRYYISINGGITWHKIYPMHRGYQGICKYYVNNNTIDNLLTQDITLKKTKNIVMVGECHSVQLKIEMDRPFVTEENYMHSTPIVYDYKLRLTTGGETIEY